MTKAQLRQRVWGYDDALRYLEKYNTHLKRTDVEDAIKRAVEHLDSDCEITSVSTGCFHIVRDEEDYQIWVDPSLTRNSK